MIIDETILQNTLVGGNYLHPDDFSAAVVKAKALRIPVVEYLLINNLTTKNILGQAFAEYHKVPFADLKAFRPAAELLQQLPEDLARKYHVILFYRDGNHCVFATNNPSNTEASTALAAAFPGCTITFGYALEEDIESILIVYQTKLETRFVNIIKDAQKIAPELVDEIFKEAFAYYASDIHFEPQENKVIIRFRMDGVLHSVGEIPKEYYDNILNRIKVMSKLRIDEHTNTQDGVIRYEYKDKRVDLRISIVPTIDGEKVEIRILSGHMSHLSLSELGLTEKNRNLLMEASKKPFGMILVTGPTGSGKTTTLYAVLQLLNHPEVNITTIEDPVEYKVAGANQIQVNPQTNLTFAQGLRSIVRQDPDIILVGEIRDTETADIAVNAALTGHLLLTTFHANDAATVIPRLLEMNLEGFILSSTLTLIAAQRLVRRICHQCRTGVPVERNELDALIPNSVEFFPEVPVTLYQGKGCAACGQTGYNGRIGIYEFLGVTEEVKDLILKNPNSSQIWDCAVSQGTKSIFEDGIEKVKNGLTSLDELMRVASLASARIPQHNVNNSPAA